ncbi:hypothetical protein EVAR_38670_1 [Eumeta japonica]|uniref:Uncharacterized protein n=1 Tax=Eumeta variegata TaxID=151549 RepID=A0A4C1Y6X2_EUMVA|nr:hypothetical protein EVAR_38670_1 [Eumeta japonica]
MNTSHYTQRREFDNEAKRRALDTGTSLCRTVTRARRTASADWWITPGTAGMRPRDLFTTSRDYRESIGVIFH